MPRLTFHKVSSPAQRADLIGQQVHASLVGGDLLALRRLAIRGIIDGCPDRDDLCQLGAIFRWVKGHVRYVEDSPAFDLYPTASVLLDFGGGDCDCHTVLVCSLASAIGFQVGATVIRPRASKDFHVYPVAFVPKSSPVEAYPLDTTWPSGGVPGVEYPPELCSYHKTFFFDLRAQPGRSGVRRVKHAGLAR